MHRSPRHGRESCDHTVENGSWTSDRCAKKNTGQSSLCHFRREVGRLGSPITPKNQHAKTVTCAPPLVRDKRCYPALVGKKHPLFYSQFCTMNGVHFFRYLALMVTNELVPLAIQETSLVKRPEPHALVAEAGGNARFAHDEFFAGIDNPHTERSYRRAIVRFLEWCVGRRLPLQGIGPADVSEYLKRLCSPTGTPSSKPTRKLHLAALRKFFDKLVERHAIAINPAAAVRGPRLSVQEGKTPAFSVDQARILLKSIDTKTVIGLRDRAVIATLVYTAARVGAVSKLRFRDYYPDGRQNCLRLDEKGGKLREIPVRTNLEGFLEEYIKGAKLAGGSAEVPLFQSAIRQTKELTGRAMTTDDILRMVKRRLKDAELPHERLTCHSFRATTITDLLSQGTPLEDVQYLAGHSDPRTTRLYDRRQRTVTRNIVERISI